MTRRLTVKYSEKRSQTMWAQFELSDDGPPVRDPSGPTVQTVARALVHYPQDAPAFPAETENDA